jgi:hypothetical protein
MEEFTLTGESCLRTIFIIGTHKKDGAGWQGADEIVYETESNIKMYLKVLTQNTVQSWVGLPV